ncbi:MAG: hypothetical protein LBC70_09750 [Chitinispirillales bacterium]|nr:hypothetical protein [Chitinispirillales bacterium]
MELQKQPKRPRYGNKIGKICLVAAAVVGAAAAPLERLLIDNDLYKPNMTAQDYNVAGMRFYNNKMWPEAQAMFYEGALMSFPGRPHVLALYNLACVISIRLSEDPQRENPLSEIRGSQRFDEKTAFNLLWLSTQLDPNRKARARQDTDFENLRTKNRELFDAITQPQEQLPVHKISGAAYIRFDHAGTFTNNLVFSDNRGVERHFCTNSNSRWVDIFVHTDEENWGLTKKNVSEKRFEIEYRTEAFEFMNTKIEEITGRRANSIDTIFENVNLVTKAVILSVKEL